MSKNICETIELLKHHKPTLIGLDRAKKAAVCIPLIETEDGWDILFEIRAADIASQPGDICFPGGLLESGETTQEAAVRETMEELLVREDQIEILGLMDVFAGGGGNLFVYPYAGILSGYEGTFSTDEVETVFCMPLTFFLENEPEVYRISMKVIPQEGFPYERIHGGRDYGWRERTEEVLFYKYEDYNIWGMTAKILKAFVDVIR
ncbi:MAG: CoA pyrophosphatase [Clostridiales bacterium]|nr:CoA pyrophosphatase [Clostridiales bacterium]